MSENKKCRFNGRELILCNLIEKTIRGSNGALIGLTVGKSIDIEKHTQYQNGIIYKWGNNKDQIVFISYCPACGENISPVVKEKYV